MAFSVAVGAVVVFLYILAWGFYGTLGLSKWVFIPVVFVLAFVQVAAVDKPKRVTFPLATYVYWSFGAVLSDLVIVFSGTFSANHLIIGGAGIQDLIFDMGFIMMLGYVFFALMYAHGSALPWVGWGARQLNRPTIVALRRSRRLRWSAAALAIFLVFFFAAPVYPYGSSQTYAQSSVSESHPFFGLDFTLAFTAQASISYALFGCGVAVGQNVTYFPHGYFFGPGLVSGPAYPVPGNATSGCARTPRAFLRASHKRSFQPASLISSFHVSRRKTKPPAA